MADTKISALPDASLPLSGAELVPVVQAAETRRSPASTFADKAVLDSLLLVDQSVAPAAPASGIKLYATNKANRRRLAWVGPNGIDSALQEFLGGNKIGYWGALGGSALGHNSANPGLILWNFGHTVYNVTVITRAVSTTNLFTSMRRIGYRTTSGSDAGLKHGLNQFSRRAGFEYIVRMGISVTGSTRVVVGLGDGGVSYFNNVGGNSQAGMIFNLDIGNNLFQLYTAETNTAVRTLHSTLDSAAFPLNTANVDMYEFRFFSPPSGSSIFWRVERLNVGVFVEGEITTNLPALDVLMGPFIAMNGVSTATSIDIVSQYIVTDY